MNTRIHTCPECGHSLSAGSPVAPCPVCLMKIGLESWTVRNAAENDPAKTPTQVAPEKFVAPAVEEIQPHFPQFEILALLGKGGMGVVYQARQKTLDRLVALKIINPTSAADLGFAERFAREARSLAKLSHQNIITVHDFGEVNCSEGDVGTSKLFYIVMEYVDGVNLRELAKSRTLSPSESLRIVPEICDALQYAHDIGIVHRDIKPENILIDRQGRVKIADFGLAKLMRTEPNDITLTGAYQAMGTMHYMAPEQMERPLEVDHRADIYALGVTFYELLTGELPIGRFAPPSKKVHVDVRLDEIVLRALEREPDQRYQRVSEIKSDVESVNIENRLPEKLKDRSAAMPPELLWASVGMIVYGVLTILLVGMYVLSSIMQFEKFGAARVFAHFKELDGLLVIGTISSFAVGVLAIASGWQVRQGKGDQLAKMTSWMMLIPWGPTIVLGLPFGLFSLFVLHRAGVRATFPQPDRTFREDFSELWNGQPKLLRQIWHVFLALCYLETFYLFFGMTGSRTAELHHFQVGNLWPWFTLNIDQGGFNWNVNLMVLIALIGLGWGLNILELWLIGVELGKKYSRHWHTVLWGICLTLVFSLGLMMLVLDSRNKPAAIAGQLTSGIITLAGFIGIGIVLAGVGVIIIRSEWKSPSSIQSISKSGAVQAQEETL